MTHQKRKILILGLDGATWRLLSHLITQGNLPTLTRLVKSGSSGVLQSSIPPLTAPAWTSFQTGANPGKHGIFDFRIFNRTTRELRLASSNEILLPTIWQIASAAGKRVITVNLPMTTPPQPINGIVISGMLSQKFNPSSVYPSERFDDLYNRHPDYRISSPVISQRGQMGIKAYIDANIKVEELRTELALDLIRSEEWDLFMLQNQCLDYIQHAYFHYMDPTSKEFDTKKHKEVLRFYTAMDNNLHRIIAEIPENTDIIVLSDHGFKLQHHLVHLTSWLRNEGYLFEEISLRDRILKIARQFDVLNLRRHLAHYILPSKSKRFGAAANASISRIDWERTTAYSPLGSVYGAIFLDKNSPGYQSLREEIRAKLCSLRNTKNGEKIVKALYFAEEIYKGEHISGGPDIIVEPEEDYTFAAPALIAHDKVVMDIGFELEIPGGHHSDGIFIWHGEGVKQTNLINCNIMDIAPTILARLGITIPYHMDGTVLDRIFSEPLSEKYITWEEFPNPTQVSGLNDDDQALNQRLRDLGYL